MDEEKDLSLPGQEPEKADFAEPIEPAQSAEPAASPEPVEPTPEEAAALARKPRKKWWLFVILGVVVLLAAAAVTIPLLWRSTCVFKNHEWIRATCQHPKTCEKCGITEGEPVEHRMLGANYQFPRHCSYCGLTEGEILQPDFELYGLDQKCTAEENVAYDYPTVTQKDPTRETVGKVTYSDFRTFEQDATHAPLAGYEWQAVTVRATFADEAAEVDGMLWLLSDSDYYTIALHDDTQKSLSQNAVSFIVNYNGIPYENCIREITTYKLGWTEECYTVEFHVFFRVPQGYDGITLCMRSAAFPKGANQHLNDLADTTQIIFRLKKAAE